MTGGDDSSMNGSMNGNGIGGGSWLNGAANGDGAGPGGFSQAVTEALKAVEGEHIDLQALLKQVRALAKFFFSLLFFSSSRQGLLQVTLDPYTDRMEYTDCIT
jgi:hypothetical protein